MTRKELPVLIMLLAGAIASIMTAVMHYEIQSLLFIVFITLVIFYFLGTILKIVLDRIEEQNTKLALDEGEVIEKEGQHTVEEVDAGENTAAAAATQDQEGAALEFQGGEGTEGLFENTEDDFEGQGDL